MSCTDLKNGWTNWIAHDGNQKLLAGEPGDLLEVKYVKTAQHGLIWFRDEIVLNDYMLRLCWADWDDWGIVCYRVHRSPSNAKEVIHALRRIVCNPKKLCNAAELATSI